MDVISYNVDANKKSNVDYRNININPIQTRSILRLIWIDKRIFSNFQVINGVRTFNVKHATTVD